MVFPELQQVLDARPDIELAVLVGSRAEGCARPESDWDIAIQWKRGLSLFDSLAKTETLRRLLATALVVEEERIDLIDLPGAKRALVAEDGVPLKGEDSLAWNHFLGRTWRELETWEWEKYHADCLYLAETAQIAGERGFLLDEARQKLQAGEKLSRLEENGVLHALQVLIENAIGKAKQILKAKGEPVLISAYDALAALARTGVIGSEDLSAWNAAIGLRNRIVHEY